MNGFAAVLYRIWPYSAEFDTTVILIGLLAQRGIILDADRFGVDQAAREDLSGCYGEFAEVLKSSWDAIQDDAVKNEILAAALRWDPALAGLLRMKGITTERQQFYLRKCLEVKAGSGELQGFATARKKRAREAVVGMMIHLVVVLGGAKVGLGAALSSTLPPLFQAFIALVIGVSAAAILALALPHFLCEVAANLRRATEWQDLVEKEKDMLPTYRWLACLQS